MVGASGSAALALVAAVLPAPLEAHAAADRTKHVNTVVIGDSITAMGKPYLHDLRPTWVIDGKFGRDVTALPHGIKRHLAHDGTPHRLVIALGQNADTDWTKADYRHATQLVPAPTEVYFISTYRDPAVFGQAAADTEATYSMWMRQIASKRPNTYMIRWRRAVIHGDVQLADGSHPTTPDGTTYWANLVLDTVLASEAS